MHNVAQMLGRQGPTGGDQLVAELLRRTYDGTKEATKRFDNAKAEYLSSGTSVYEIPFPEMTVLLSYWVALVHWEMATAYTDGIIVTYFDSDALDRDVYEYADSYCDLASEYNRDAIKLSGEFAAGKKISMAGMLGTVPMEIHETLVNGQWGANLALINRVLKDLRFIGGRNVPKRVTAFHEDLLRRVIPIMNIVESLKRDWQITTMLDNKCELAGELDKQAHEMFEIGQCIWAPYQIGGDLIDTIRRIPTLDELAEEFDPWILTDPYKRDESKSLLEEFWDSVADRDAVLALAEEVRVALETGKLRRRTDDAYPKVPWPSQFLVHDDVRLGSRDFDPGSMCAYYVHEDDEGKTLIDVRRSGRLTKPLELLGQTVDSSK